MDEPSAPLRVAGVSVADLVATLRTELEELDAKRQKKGIPPLLALDSVDVEVYFTVATASNGDAELRILPAGSWEGVQPTAVQKVSLHFTVDDTARREGRLGSRAHSSTFPPAPDDDLEPLDDPSDGDA